MHDACGGFISEVFFLLSLNDYCFCMCVWLSQGDYKQGLCNQVTHCPNLPAVPRLAHGRAFLSTLGMKEPVLKLPIARSPWLPRSSPFPSLVLAAGPQRGPVLEPEGGQEALGLGGWSAAQTQV